MHLTDTAIPAGERLTESIDTLLGIVSAPVGWLAFNNPKRHNAVSRSMWEAAPGIIARFVEDPRVKVIALMGVGGRAFVSGADISEFESQRATVEGNHDYRQAAGRAGTALMNSPKPTVAMIRGACIGGGLATALNCDLRIAARGSRFGIPAARLGIGYPFAGVQRLVALVGPARAKAMLMTARLYSADDALAMGLIGEVVDDSELEVATAALTGALAANAPLSIAAAKLAVDAAVRDPGERDLDAVKAAVARAMGSEDFVEGRRAFMEKRAPAFKGR